MRVERVVSEKSAGRRGRSRIERRGRLRAVVARGLAATLLAGGLAGNAHATGFLEKNIWLPRDSWSGQIPACDTPAALGTIQSRFAETESRFWGSSIRLDGFDRIRELAFRPWGPENQPRRYCEARVFVSDGKVSTVYYSLIEDGGWQALTWGVDWCVMGYDRGLGHPPDCRTALP
ncbi:hypothetical protein MWN34_07215 [Ancylobacter sp. 6x-1]|uniref:DUF4864 domain-containing protein n=1 Tax=Ancylobacter crimeensis TaxID=2579147 RepID=A0ABT0D9T2_9HYPH|nr:hypothetical protein [Ancylobacter crimeensis]MCK0196703.1 hypothetical protein [Ancylobacter crimeensis]